MIKKGTLRWAGHAIRRQNSLLRTVLEKNPVGKRPLGRFEMERYSQEGYRRIKRRSKLVGFGDE